MRQATDYPPAG